MHRAPSVRPLLLAAAALLVAALLPTRWLRPGPDPLRGESDAVIALTADRDAYRALWHGEQLRSEELLQRLEDARLAETFHLGSVFDPVRADVVGRGPDARRGPVRLNAGAAAGVRPGDVAVFRGAHLVGRVTGEASRLTSLLLPVHDRATGRLHGAVSREPEPANPTPVLVRVLLAPEGDGTFVADAAVDSGVRVGDQVVLDDPDWPDTARGMIVGAITAIEPREEQPLRVRLRVRPLYDVHELRSVILKTTPGAADAGAAGAPGGSER